MKNNWNNILPYLRQSPITVESFQTQIRDFNEPEYDITGIIIDHGSDTFKIGFDNQDTPKSLIKPVIGRNKKLEQDMRSNFMYLEPYIGKEAFNFQKEKNLELCFPFEKGEVQDFDNLEKIYHSIFYKELKIVPEEHPVLLSLPIQIPATHREKICQIMFETFNVPAIYFACQQLLSLISSGKTSGLVVDLGNDLISVVPIHNFSIDFNNSFSQNDFSGSHLTDYLFKMIVDSHHLDSFSKKDAQNIKENFAYVAFDFEEETQLPQDFIQKEIELTDKSKIKIGKERFLCSEPLFDPKMVDKNQIGIHKKIWEMIQKFDIDQQDFYLQNIILTGGSSLFPRIEDRLWKELAKLSLKTNISLTKSKNPIIDSWIGGSLISSREGFQNFWISKEEYDESGPSIHIRKVF
ncbi:actin epsilon 1 [Anaeramoeba ignava]|uniref:Actin epsilon 1 n=1 Tax=Anaeramoeba ignava TaxID=1746090 RepID=A0A9Q0LMF9_ANAIG|nr:actin epsilon 1 [Anaeramoeba ignava]